jgi:hypothetical protein
MKTSIWMSFDLGIQGDYDGLYQWLDSHGAIECGENVAYFKMESNASDVGEDIKKQLQGIVKDGPKTRIYIIRRVKMPNNKDTKMMGRFIFGQRKAPVWAGFAPKAATEESA